MEIIFRTFPMRLLKSFPLYDCHCEITQTFHSLRITSVVSEMHECECYDSAPYLLLSYLINAFLRSLLEVAQVLNKTKLGILNATLTSHFVKRFLIQSWNNLPTPRSSRPRRPCTMLALLSAKLWFYSNIQERKTNKLILTAVIFSTLPRIFKFSTSLSS